MLTPAQEAWLQALESGEFKQTACSLQDKLGFCCLGVACIVAEKHGVDIVRTTASSPEPFLAGRSLGVQPLVQKWLGLRTGSGESTPGSMSSLTSLNDCGRTFKEIAQRVRQHPELYFEVPNADTCSGNVAPGP